MTKQYCLSETVRQFGEEENKRGDDEDKKNTAFAVFNWRASEDI